MTQPPALFSKRNDASRVKLVFRPDLGTMVMRNRQVALALRPSAGEAPRSD